MCYRSGNCVYCGLGGGGVAAELLPSSGAGSAGSVLRVCRLCLGVELWGEARSRGGLAG